MAAIPTHTLQARFKRIEIILIRKSRYETVICHTVIMYPFVTDIHIKKPYEEKAITLCFFAENI